MGSNKDYQAKGTTVPHEGVDILVTGDTVKNKLCPLFWVIMSENGKIIWLFVLTSTITNLAAVDNRAASAEGRVSPDIQCTVDQLFLHVPVTIAVHV